MITINNNGCGQYDSFVLYNNDVAAAKAEKSRYLITFLKDECMKHMSVLFHAFYPDRLFYFNTGCKTWCANMLPILRVDHSCISIG